MLKTNTTGSFSEIDDSSAVTGEVSGSEASDRAPIRVVLDYLEKGERSFLPRRIWRRWPVARPPPRLPPHSRSPPASMPNVRRLIENGRPRLPTLRKKILASNIAHRERAPTERIECKGLSPSFPR